MHRSASTHAAIAIAPFAVAVADPTDARPWTRQRHTRGEPHRVHTRVWSAPQRRAIRVRDRHCRGPNCNRPIGWTEIHHLQWWRHDGPTDLDNGLALCHACHRLVHEMGWHAELDLATAAVTWTSPDRRRTVVTHPRRPS